MSVDAPTVASACLFVCVCVKRPYGFQNNLAEWCGSEFENVQSSILCNRKRQMKNKGKKKMTYG